LFTLGTALLGHRYWKLEGAERHANMLNFYKNLSITGGLLLLAVTGPGKYALTGLSGPALRHNAARIGSYRRANPGSSTLLSPPGRPHPRRALPRHSGPGVPVRACIPRAAPTPH